MGNDDDSQLRDDWGLDGALDGLGLSSYTYLRKGGKNRILGMAHVDPYGSSMADHQTYQVNGQTYRATDADYTMSFNTEEGVIIGLSREGPATSALRRNPSIPAAQMPILHQFSDVGWLTWQEMTKRDGHDAKNLRYLISVSIENQKTLSVCRRVFINNRWKGGPWPGLTLKAGTDDFHAILGTPNMQG
ncbi:hypothetical protein AA0118_g10700 [Alternaria tenuissima]|nr:hypothetical protein AA0118_g10700 [Alternaria tenuissima]